MIRLLRQLAVIVVGIGLAAWLLGGAIDHELATGASQVSAAKVGLPAGNPSEVALPTRHQGKGVVWWSKRAVQARKDANARGRTIRRLKRELANREIGPTLAIRLVFGPHAHEALRVSWCESRWWTGARNGQYLGLFQMGDYARSRYGHASDALGQARAAFAYFVESGRDWSPWECKP